ncbi:MAG TPA: Sec-independent protein translocase protein TatB [Herpetosiphonaceae bacterium]
MTIFGIGPVELVIIVIIALVVVGPERLPEMLYQLGQGLAKLRGMVSDMRAQARAELGDDYDSIQEMGRQLRELDPRRQIQDFSRSVLSDLNEVTKIDLGPPPPPKAVPLPQPDARLAAQSILGDDLLDAPLSESLDSLETPANE